MLINLQLPVVISYTYYYIHSFISSIDNNSHHSFWLSAVCLGSSPSVIWSGLKPLLWSIGSCQNIWLPFFFFKPEWNIVPHDLIPMSSVLDWLFYLSIWVFSGLMVNYYLWFPLYSVLIMKYLFIIERELLEFTLTVYSWIFHSLWN